LEQEKYKIVRSITAAYSYGGNIAMASNGVLAAIKVKQREESCLHGALYYKRGSDGGAASPPLIQRAHMVISANPLVTFITLLGSPDTFSL